MLIELITSHQTNIWSTMVKLAVDKCGNPVKFWNINKRLQGLPSKTNMVLNCTAVNDDSEDSNSGEFVTDHVGLIYKLQTNTNGWTHFSPFIHYCLIIRIITPIFNGKMGIPFNPKTGVSQVSVIRPLPFNLLSVTPGVRGRFHTVTTFGRLGRFSSITFFSFFFFSGHYTDDSFYAIICFFLRFDYVLVVNC